MPEIDLCYPELLTVPMSDGGTLAVHRYPSNSGGASPAVVVMTPYRKEGAIAGKGNGYPARGYDFFIADVRGFGGSKGEYHGLLSSREIQDYCELIEWIARQPFCNGKVASVGGSYTGGNQMLMAARKPKGLVCIAPAVGMVDWYRDGLFRGGIWTFAIWGMTYFRSGQEETLRRGMKHFYNELMTDKFDNAGHHGRASEYILKDIQVPSFLIGGWDDYFIRGTTRAFMQIPAPKAMFVGPGGHGNHGGEEETFRWLDYWMKGEGENPTGNKRVRLIRTGSNEWIERGDWFNFERAKWWHWHPFTEPTKTRVIPNFNGIPAPANAKPVLPADSGYSYWPEVHTQDSAPLEKTTDIDGQLALEFFVDAGECADIDVHARISVVRPDGTIRQLAEGRHKASQRNNDLSKSYKDAEGYPIIPWHTHDREEKLTGGQFTRMTIEVNPICHRFFAGDRVRFGLSIVRSDGEAVPATAIIGPKTRVFLPLTTGVEG